MEFEGFFGDWTPTGYDVSVRRVKDIFGDYVNGFERKDSGGSGFFDTSGTYFPNSKYGLYEVEVTARLEFSTKIKTVSFKAKVVVDNDSVRYNMKVYDNGNVYIDKL